MEEKKSFSYEIQYTLSDMEGSTGRVILTVVVEEED